MTEDHDSQLLTDGMRDYLVGKKRFENKDTEENHRSRIRTRVRDIIIDFKNLNEAISRDEHRGGFQKLRFVLDVKQSDRGAVREGIINLFAFLYRECQRSGYDFQALLSEGIKQAKKDSQYGVTEVSVSTSIDVTNAYDLEKAHEKYKEGGIGQLSIEDLTALSILGRDRGIVTKDESDEDDHDKITLSEIDEELANRTGEDIQIVRDSDKSDT